MHTLGNYYDKYKYRKVSTNQLTWKRSLYDWNASFEKYFIFYANHFKFCAVKKNIIRKYLKQFSTENNTEKLETWYSLKSSNTPYIINISRPKWFDWFYE